ncbi:hypothetical protein GCM10022416_34470 [Actinomadura keratinilytica]|uniref:HTH luxR-type domain-containing protein n=1 Tax=Actinomadura keratinilytica TaxID=547461 RepID=A0ABP7YZ51_9ACTN
MPARRAALLDLLLWAVLSFPMVVTVLPPRAGQARWWLEAAAVLVLGAAIAVGRAWPLTALVTGTALTAVHGNFVFALPVLAYQTGLRRTRARPVLWGFTGIFVAGTVWNLVRGVEVTVWFPLTIWLVLLGVLPWLAGRYWRQYRQLLHAGWERAEQLEREQRIVAERERLRERARIAQDMHDSLGHELALLAVRAGALQVAPGLADRHRAADAELRAWAAEATERLRQIIGVLREDTAPDAAPDAASGAGAGAVSAGDPPVPDVPVGRAVAELVDRARASGIPVTLVQQPPPPADPPEDTPGDTSGDTSGDRAGDTPGGTAGEGAAELARAAPGTAVAILTTFGEDEYIARALSGGASGFLLKSGDPHELIAGVRAVAGGAAYLSPKVAHRVITELRGGRLAHGAHARRRIAALTPRERQVLALVGAGLSNAEIASRLHVVEGTVKAYVSTILMRLEVRNRVQAAIVAYEAGLIDGTPAP